MQPSLFHFTLFQEPESQSLLQDVEAVSASGWEDGIDEPASQPASQGSAVEMSAIEKELEVWNHLVDAGPKDSADYDILAFWKQKEAALPNLAWLAKRILCIPASSTASERSFSAGGRVVSSSRTLLNSDKAETLIWIMQNFREIDPLITKYVLRNKDYRKIDKERKKAAEQASKDKEKESEKGKDASDSTESDAGSESEYSDDEFDDIVSIHDSD